MSLLLSSASADPVPAKPVLRFAFVGDSSLGFRDQTPENLSSANRRQLLQTCADLAQNPPDYFFWLGDLVTNYAEGGEVLRGQLQAWRELYQQTELAKSQTKLVPVVGNHEVLRSEQDPVTKAWTDFPNPATLPVWNEVMDSYLLWSDGPTTEGENHDGLTYEQTRLSFTVRQDNVLFICINTDTFIDDVTIADVPLHWIEQTLNQAEADPTVDHVFVMGHRPIERPGLPGVIIRDEKRDGLERLLAASSKTRAYLAGHFHLWDCRTTELGVLQVIAGNGGTAPSGSFNTEGRGHFGYTVVELLDDGRLVLESWGRPIPTPYNSNEPQPAAQLIEARTIFAP